MYFINLILKRSIQLGALWFVVWVIWANTQLYYTPTWAQKVNSDALAQLKYLKKTLKTTDAAAQMQQLYPEGAFFLTVLYGLAWTDIAEKVDTGSVIMQEAEREIVWAFNQLSEDSLCKAVFDSTLLLNYGAFYNGWRGYLLGRYCMAFRKQGHDEERYEHFRYLCDDINTAFLAAKSPYLESYLHQSWPADNILCLATLSLHDSIFHEAFTDTRKRWLDSIQQHLDPTTGLIPHSYHLTANEIRETPRGCSQSMMLSFLPMIDSAFSQAQFAKFQQHFMMKKWGIWSVREYPQGVDGKGDVDSGPIILGVGGAASIVGIRAAGENQKAFLHANFRNAIEMLGFPNHFNGEKSYLLKQLPIADAFIAWVSAKDYDFKNPKYAYWQWEFHLWSLLLVSAPCYYLGLYFVKYFL
jgi:hypothetical protein